MPPRLDDGNSGTKGLAEATRTIEGDGAGMPVRKVAMSWRSSEPSSGATVGFGAELGGIGGNTQIWTFSGRARIPF